MRLVKQAIGVLLSTLIAAPAAPAAGDCVQVLDQIAADAKAFQAESQKMSMDFLRDDALQQALEGAKRSLDTPWSPDLERQREALYALSTGQSWLESWQRRVSAFSSQVDDIERCVHDPGCSLLEESKKLNENLRRWLQSFGSEDLSSTAERVGKAAGLLRGYSSRLAGIAEGSARSAVSCMSQAAAQQSAQQPVDLRQSPAGTAPASPPATSPGGATPGAKPGASTAGAKGPSTTTRILLGVGAVGAGVGLGAVVANSATQAASCPTASDLAATAGGGIVAVGTDTICTQWIDCGIHSPRLVRSCGSHICDAASCSIYYEFGGGGRVVCLTGCDARSNPQQLSSAIMNCATRAAASCE